MKTIEFKQRKINRNAISIFQSGISQKKNSMRKSNYTLCNYPQYDNVYKNDKPKSMEMDISSSNDRYTFEENQYYF